ncbi:MAG: V-type ATP synthase subunit I [Firmicutes bacterium]|nr:V-type ATP synthase subunit I [Bacillota bacterium]
MSIIKMQRVAVIGLDTEKEKLMNQLMDFGAVELTDQSGKLSEEIWADNTSVDEDREKVSAIEAKLNRAEQSLEVIEKYGDIKHPLFKTRRSVKKSQMGRMLADENANEKNVDYILGLNEKIHSLNEKLNKLNQDAASLNPWVNYDPPLEITGTGTTALFTGVLPAGADTEGLSAHLEEEIGTVLFKVVGSDKDMFYTAVLTPEERQDDVLAELKQSGFSQVTFKGMTGTVSENLKRIEGEKDVLEKEIKETADEIAATAGMKNGIEEYSDILSIDLDKEKIRAKLLKTRKTFFIEGWVPERCIPEASAILDENGCYYTFRDPLDDEEVPVLMENTKMVVPFEAVTEMYSLPAYYGFDPTRIFALFYAVFFGMMLSDAGYGILMAVGCFVALKKFDLEGMTYKMVKMFFYCGISTTIWGALFGGWFGDIVPVFTRTFLGKEVAVSPLWFNPLDDPMKLLILSLALGVVHIFIGMGIKAYMQIKEGKWLDAICDEGFWYVTIIGLIAWLGGGTISDSLTTVGMYMSIIGGAGLLLTGGRHNKGFGKITGGLSNIYNITSYMSDILSYARLLALGLATGVIAQVVNTMGTLFGGGIGGLIALTIIFLFGHTLNLAINALGAFIHASRLQYVEFFGKFYEDGGEPFDPFRRKTKYIKLED